MSNLNKNKVLVGMSGGVDSSAVAGMLLEQGYEVVGFTITPFKILDECKTETHKKSCCTFQSMYDAHDVCEKLGIEHILLDMTEAFRDNIVNNFIDEYMQGRTPNPCVHCNTLIKWKGMLDKADSVGAYYVATGHYASLHCSKETNRYTLIKGEDSNKDQTYFLWRLTQEQLGRTLLPLGHINKTETREIAKRMGMAIHAKADSQEVCFLPKNDYRTFLKKQIPYIENKYADGNIVLNGEIVGKHQGFPFYTIGQRKGIGVTNKDPLYVKNIIPETNTIEVAFDNDLNNTSLLATTPNLMKYDNIKESKIFNVKIRYRDSGSPAWCRINSDGLLEINFEENKRAITPGQSVVLYEGNELVGGGIIQKNN